MGELHAKFAWDGYSCCLWILRPGSTTAHRHRGQALCLETRPCPPHRSLRRPPHRSLRRPPRRWGLVSCWRATTLPRVRYKILPAQLLGGDNGIKLSLHVEKVPNRAILGEQGEFCTGSGAVRLVQGEFCTGSGAARLVLGEFCFVVAPSVYAVAGFPPPTGAPSWPSRPCSALDTGSGGGFALHEALNRCVAGVSHPLVVQFPPSRGLPDGRSTQNADHLAKKR